MGILDCKKIFEQRSLISHVLNNRMAELVSMKSSVLGIKPEDMKKANIFNETYHNAIKYCETERKFGVFNTIFNIAKQIDQENLSEAFSS
jgi:vacuolar-type H+-ATPase catalytic subunit A/Vma1